MGKKLFLVLVLAIFLASCVSAYAEEPQSEPQPAWYELNSEDMILTITLPANATTGYEWGFEISEPKALELITQEYVPDEAAEGQVGVGGTWVASFNATGDMAGNVALTLNYKRSGDEAAAETRVVNVWIVENMQLEIVSTEITTAGAPAWCELSGEETVLTVRLPANATTGYEWGFEISEPKAFELITEEYVEDEAAEGQVGVGGTWVASFKPTGDVAGNVALTMNYERSGDEAAAETRVVNVWIVENMQLEIVSTTITTPVPEA